MTTQDRSTDAGRRLDELGEEYLGLLAEADPFTASVLGIPGHDARVPDVSSEARADVARRMGDLRHRVESVPRDMLDATASASRALLLHDCTAVLDDVEARTVDWQLGSLVGPAQAVLSIAPKASVTTDEGARDYAERCAALPEFVDASAAALRRGAADGLVANREVLAATLATVEDYLAAPSRLDPLLVPLAKVTDASVRGRTETTVVHAVRPAMARLRDTLRDTLLPLARPGEQCGLMHLPGGDEMYRRFALRHTTTDETPEQLHATGLQVTEALQDELAELGGRVLGCDDPAEIRRRLRNDPALRCSSSGEILAASRSAMRRAEEAMPDWFGLRHRSPCEISAMNEVEAASAVLGYYRPPALDGSHDGGCWINTADPRSRPRFEIEALTFHETVPGHHLQFALAHEQAGLPAFRRLAYVTAFGEGWGLYTERLADEMGLYSSDLDRFGMISFDSWRAARLVVDTGVHALGWSRQQAIDHMWNHTVLTMTNIVNEVDRYISMPGQALAYMTGRIEIDRLRAAAETALGSRFDIRSFHDVVVGGGSIPLTELADVVERWTQQRAA